MASSSSSSSSSSAAAQQEQATPNSNTPSLAGAQTCLTVVQGAVTLASMPMMIVCQLLKGVVALQGQDGRAVAMQALGALRDALDEMLEDGSNEGERKRKRGMACLDESEKRSTAVHPTPTVAACAQVLQDPHLLTPIIGWLFHEHHTLPSRVALGRAALVCKEWKYVSRQTCFWQPLLRELRPAIGANDESLVQGRGYESHFTFLCSYGKCLVEKGVVTGDVDLFDGLELQVEMWNAGNDDVPSHRIYSAVGPIRASINAGAAPHIVLRLSGPSRKEVAGPAFSAADLDPVQRLYPTMAECFGTAHELSNPLNLCMRVSVLDRQTGKMALVWSSGKETKYAFLQTQLGAYSVQPPAWTRLHRQRRTAASSPSTADTALDEIGAIAAFPLRHLPGQEGVDPIERKYQANILPGGSASFSILLFDVPEAKTVAAFLRSLLQ